MRVHALHASHIALMTMACAFPGIMMPKTLTFVAVTGACTRRTHSRGLCLNHRRASYGVATQLREGSRVQAQLQGPQAERLDFTRHQEVNEFYRDNGYRAVCRPADILWALRHNGELVGALRLSPQRFRPLGDMLHLRSLFVVQEWRRQGLGTLLICSATREHSLPMYCFAYQELVPLYHAAGWSTNSQLMPSTILDQFSAVVNQTARKHKSVALMTYGMSHGEMVGEINVDTGRQAETQTASGTHKFLQKESQNQQGRLRVVLLQHVKEVERDTGTGAILGNETLQLYLELQRWVWRGRGDNAHIAAQLAANNRNCVLVWADTAHPPLSKEAVDGKDASDLRSSSSNIAATAATAAQHLDVAACVYIILDGTWQEARGMFRKCSALHSLPRLSLLNTRTSSYVLRGDFGWREKFGGGGGGGASSSPPHTSSAARAGGNNEDEAELLCTAEVGGELLRRAGHLEGSAQVVRVLQEFQMQYAESHPHIALRLRGREGSKQG